MLEDYFYFSRSDRRALSLFAIVIALSVIFRTAARVNAGSPVPDGKSAADSLAAAVPISVAAADTAVHPTADSAGNGSGLGYGTLASGRAAAGNRTSRYVRQEKYPYGTRIDLNAADTVELKKIPGIGSYFAYRIVRYREQLGGYARTAQLLEIERLPDSVVNWFFVADTFRVRRMNVNTATFSRLRSHPYMDYYKARAITDYRSREGTIKGPAQLSLFEVFSERDLERLEPYLSYEASGTGSD